MSTKKKIFLGIAAIVFIGFLITSYIRLTFASANNLPQLKNGDIVFQTIQSSQTMAIMFASKSPYTHVGIVKIKNDGPYVVEAVGPVREVKLDKWISQGIAGRISVLRIKDLRPDDAKRAIKAAETYYGRPYDFYFLLDKERIYCSELVHYAFKEGPGIEVGEIEKVGDLNTKNVFVRKLMEKRWHKYPPCTNKAKDFQSCFDIILEQELITPTSLIDRNTMDLIYSNY